MDYTNEKHPQQLEAGLPLQKQRDARCQSETPCHQPSTASPLPRLILAIVMCFTLSFGFAVMAGSMVTSSWSFGQGSLMPCDRSAAARPRLSSPEFLHRLHQIQQLHAKDQEQEEEEEEAAVIAIVETIASTPKAVAFYNKRQEDNSNGTISSSTEASVSVTTTQTTVTQDTTTFETTTVPTTTIVTTTTTTSVDVTTTTSSLSESTTEQSTTPISEPTSVSTETEVSSNTRLTVTHGDATTSSAVPTTITSTLSNGGLVIVTTTTWVAVVPTSPSEADNPELQDAAVPRFQGSILVYTALSAVVGLVLAF